VWDFEARAILYRVKFHKNRIQALSFSCSDVYLVSLGGQSDGNQVALWNMAEGVSECVSPASQLPSETCQDIRCFNRTDSKFITVHNNAVKVWEFLGKGKKMRSVDCSMGHIKRYINCVSVDPSDTYGYCGTRTGDILEILLDKATFKRVGPLNRIFTGGIHQVLSFMHRELVVAAGDGSIAKIDKKEMKITE